MTPRKSGSTPVDSFFAAPMVLLGLTFPVFFFLSEDIGRTVGWLLYGAGLLLTVGGFVYCGVSRKSPSFGGASCAVGAAVIGLIAWNVHGWPW
ncbi:hypothetical protein OG749_24745 [Streptomyces nojiriensis]|uniref:hypothetical protein n=1 Tax=Streptomyces nojiriensis TaxID=66374 RepID=UPI002E189D65